MDFDTNASNIVLVISEIKRNFQHTYACLNERLV